MVERSPRMSWLYRKAAAQWLSPAPLLRLLLSPEQLLRGQADRRSKLARGRRRSSAAAQFPLMPVERSSRQNAVQHRRCYLCSALHFASAITPSSTLVSSYRTSVFVLPHL